MNFDVQKIWDSCLDWIWPRNCEICGGEGDWCCIKCKGKISKFISVQVCPDCRKISKNGTCCDLCGKKWSIDGLIVSVERSKELKKIVMSFKYHDVFRLDEILAEICIEQIKILKIEFDLIGFVPLARKRLWWRGYNQSQLLAKIIARNCRKQLVDLLSRERFLRPQVGLNKIDRLVNVKNVFIAGKEIKKCLNKKVLLVDDVCTTMATLNECSIVLKNNGASEVMGIVLARGV